MDGVGVLVGIALGLLVGAGAVWFAFRGRSLHAEERAKLLDDELKTALQKAAGLEPQAAQAAELSLKLEAKDRAIDGLKEEIAEFQAKRREQEAALAEKERALQEKLALIDQELPKAFAQASQEALKKNNELFLELAGQNLEKKQEAIDNLVKPIRDALEKVDKQVQEVEKDRKEAYGGLIQHLRSVSDTQQKLEKETSNLVRALGKSSHRGRWGELQLQRVCEMAGMLQYCDFLEQQSTDTEEGRLRPDVVVRLPSNKTIVVDAKTPMEAYLQATESADDVERAELLKSHVKHIRTHIQQLGAKRYWDQQKVTPEFVVMFIPLESMWSAALQIDPQLIEVGVENRVIVATPVTLIGLLKAVAYGWKQENLAENAQKISDLGRELYGRMAKMADHFGRVGKSLDHAVSAYNDTVGTLDNRILPQARKFRDLHSATADEIKTLDPIDKVSRELQAPEFKELPIAAIDGVLFEESASVE